MADTYDDAPVPYFAGISEEETEDYIDSYYDYYDDTLSCGCCACCGCDCDYWDDLYDTDYDEELED